MHVSPSSPSFSPQGVILKHLIGILNNNDDVDMAFGSRDSAQESPCLGIKRTYLFHVTQTILHMHMGPTED